MRRKFLCMIDYFALLDVERRPAITEETVKGAYFRKSESLHMDPSRSDEVFAVNAAFQTIANPATRIQHLLRLEFGDAGGGQIPPDLENYSVRSSKCCKSPIWSSGLSQPKAHLFSALWPSRSWTDSVRDCSRQKRSFLSESLVFSPRSRGSIRAGLRTLFTPAGHSLKSRLV